MRTNNCKIELYINGTLQSAHPIYSDAIAINKSRASGEMYHRTTLDSDFTFVRDDYDAIFNASLNAGFVVMVKDATSGSVLASGVFRKTDCTFNTDDKICNVKVTSVDAYDKILGGLNNEYDLISLAPERETITLWKRAILQIYVMHDTKVTNVIGNMSFEVDVASGFDADRITKQELEDDYNFEQISTGGTEIIVSSMPSLFSSLVGTYVGSYIGEQSVFTQQNGTNKIVVGKEEVVDPETGDGTFYFWEFKDADDNVITDIAGNVVKTRPLWQNVPSPYGTHMAIYGFQFGYNIYDTQKGFLWEKDEEMVSALVEKDVYARILMDATTIQPIGTVKDIPTEDICATNMNYNFSMRPTRAYHLQNSVVISSTVQDEPTKYGINGEGKYFVQPAPANVGDNVIPIGWNRWIPNSYWLNSTASDARYLDRFSVKWELNDAYPLWSVIQVLLNQIDPSITFEGTSDYSRFIYGTIPLYDIVGWRKALLYLTPSTNVKKSYYSQAARKGNITLGQIFEMLKSVWQLYWFIDSDKKLRIEHISWFKNGGNYSQSTPLVDLTEIRSPKLGNVWDFAQNTFSYDKSLMIKRYEFGWNGQVSEVFDGFPIDIKDRYADEGKTNKANASNFVSDIDLILSAPDVVSDDCFVVIGTNIAKECEIVSVNNMGMDFVAPIYVMQNPYLSYYWGEIAYWNYDLTGRTATIFGFKDSNGGDGRIAVHGTKRLKKQTISFPIKSEDVGKLGLFKTSLGEGEWTSEKYNIESGMLNADIMLETEDPWNILWDDLVRKSDGQMTMSVVPYGNGYRFTIDGHKLNDDDWGYVKIIPNGDTKITIRASCEQDWDNGYVGASPYYNRSDIRNYAYAYASGTETNEYQLEAGETFYIGFTKDESVTANDDKIIFDVEEL